MQVKEIRQAVPTEFLNDYKQLIKENKELQREKDRLEVRIEILEKALLFVASKVDEINNKNVEYFAKQILQK